MSGFWFVIIQSAPIHGDALAFHIADSVFIDSFQAVSYTHLDVYKRQDPMRPRKLLLNKSEIRKIDSVLQQQGLTLIPLSIYLNEKGMAKLEIGIARGKKLYDKRQDIAKRDANRNIDRMMKSRNR